MKIVIAFYRIFSHIECDGKSRNLLSHVFGNIFVEATDLLATVWKNTQKRDHAKKISVKSHSKNLPIQLLQMHDFIFLGDIFGLNEVNEIERAVFKLVFIVKNIFTYMNLIKDIWYQR